MKTKILIVGEEGFSNGMMHFVISRDYAKQITLAGGLPILAADLLHAEEYLDFADGLLLTGGMDLHCSLYGDYYRKYANQPPTFRTRDELDLLLCKAFFQAKKPIFGIGRGMQVINVALGGTLLQDLEDLAPSHSKTTQDSDGYCEATYHKVTISENSLLSQIWNENETVNSCHHQAIGTLGKGLRITATSPDGVAEGIEHTSLPCFGVQWHPERELAEQMSDVRPFEYFIKLCKEGKK